MRVDDVLAAGIPARRGDCEVVRLDDGRDPIRTLGVSDSDVPAVAVLRMPADDDVPARVDREVLRAGGLEDRRGPVDRPTFDETGGSRLPLASESK